MMKFFPHLMAAPIFWGFPKKWDQHGSDQGTYLGWFHAFALVGINPPMRLLTSIRHLFIFQFYVGKLLKSGTEPNMRVRSARTCKMRFWALGDLSEVNFRWPWVCMRTRGQGTKWLRQLWSLYKTKLIWPLPRPRPLFAYSNIPPYNRDTVS